MKSFSGAEAGRRGINELRASFRRGRKDVNELRTNALQHGRERAIFNTCAAGVDVSLPRGSKKLSSIWCPLHGYVRLWLNYNGYLIRRPTGLGPSNRRYDLAVPSLGTLKQSPRPGSLKTFSHCL